VLFDVSLGVFITMCSMGHGLVVIFFGGGLDYLQDDLFLVFLSSEAFVLWEVVICVWWLVVNVCLRIFIF